MAVAGFLVAAAGILPATFTASPTASVWYTCIAVFGLETTVGVSWAIPLDIAGDYAGSVASVMNTFGNLGGAMVSLVVGLCLKYLHSYDAAMYSIALFYLAAAACWLFVDLGGPTTWASASPENR